MDYFDIGDTISRADLNSLVYLLRKFKRLTKDLTIGPSEVKTEYGTFNFTDGFRSTGNNWILENDVTITSDNVLTNTFYTFMFNVIDVNMSGAVNTRTVSVTSQSTGDYGILNVVVGEDILGEGEVLLPDYTLSITFDEHEYYTPLSEYSVELSVEKETVLLYEDNTIYLTLTQESEPVAYALTSIVIDGEEFFSTTDDEGVAEFTYTGKGAGTVTVTTLLDSTASVSFIDNPDYVSTTVTGSSVTLGNGGDNWLVSDGDIIVDWGDGTTSTINNPTTALSHTYTDNQSSHNILFVGNVIELGNNCFYNVTGLTSVTMLDSITGLGDYCFNGCSGLTSVTIPGSVTNLGDRCFEGCSSLTSVTIPDTITSLGLACFRDCTSLTSIDIPDSVTSIGISCFRNCTGLTSMAVSDNVTSIGNYCFDGCTGLTSIGISNSVTTLGTACFRNCTSLTSVTIPNNVSVLGDYCFNGCTGLTSVSLPNNLTVLNNNLFNGCSSLSSISIPVNVVSIGLRCFYGCTSLTSVNLPPKMSSIGEYAFRGCSNLASINIPDSVRSIGTSCFVNCTSLIDYQLYWTGEDIIDRSTAHLINNTNTRYTVPNGTYDLYADKNYPSSKIIERGYRLSLTANKNTIQSGETSTITVTLYNDGVVSSSKTLDYTIKHGGTVITSGTKTTNNNGQATITYTGTAIGEIEVIVSYSNLLQKTLTIRDVWFYDTGVSGTASTDWYESTTSGSKTVTSTGTTFSNTASQEYRVFANKPNTSTDIYDYDSPYCVEVDILDYTQSTDDPVYIQFYSNETSNGINTRILETGHYKLTYDGQTRKYWIDGVEKTPYDVVIGTSRIGFRVYTNTSVTFKNFCIYPIDYGENITINTNKNTIYDDESLTLTGTVTNDGLPVANATVTVYQGSTSLGTVKTNQNGVYTKTVSGLSAGDYVFKTVYDTVESNTVNITVQNHTYALSVATNKSSMYTDDKVIVSGVLTKDSLAWNNQQVTIYDGTTNKGQVTTNANGAYSKTLTGLTAGSHTLKAQHTNATSSTVSLTVNNHSYDLSATASKSTIYTNESTVLSGTLKKDNVVWADQTITIYDGSTSLGTVKTNSSGVYSKTVSGLSAGSHTLKAQHANVTSSDVPVTVNNHTYSLTASLGSNNIYTDGSTTISGTLKQDGKVYANQEVTIYNGSTSLGTVSTNNNGVYTKTLTGLPEGTYSLKASYGSTNSSTVTLTVKNHNYTVTASVSPTSIYSNQSTVIQGTLTRDGVVYANQTVTIYDGSSQIATASTDSSGNFHKELTGLSLGQHSLRAGYSGVYSGSTVVTVTDAYNLTISSNKTSYIAGETTTITGSLLRNGSGVNYAYVYLYDGDTLLSQRRTNLHGDYTYSYQFEHGSHTIRAVYNSVEASTTFTVTDYDVTMTTSSASIYSDQSVTVSGTLLRGGVGYSGQTVTIYDGNTSLTTVTTGTGGAFSKSINGLSVGSHNLRAEYSGVYSSTSSVTVTVAYTLTANVSPTTLYTDGSVTVSGILTYHGSGYADKIIKIYDGDSEISMAPFTTGNDGSYSKSVSGFTAGQHSIKTSYGSYITSSATSITVNNHTYSLTGTTSKDTYYIDETPVFTGVLKKDGATWSGQSVEIYVDGSYEDTVTTNSSGVYSFNVDMLVSTGQHTLQAKHTNVNSTVKTITVNAHSYSLTAGASPTTITYGQSTTVSGVLSKDGSGWTGQTVQIKEGSTVVASGTSGTSGAYSISVSGLSVGSHTLKAVHSNASSSNMSVTVNKISTTTSLSASSTSISTTDTLTLSGSVTYATSGTVKIYNGSTLVADNVAVSGGAFSKSLTGLSAGTYNYKAVFQSDSTHNSSESSVVQVTVTSPAHTYTLEVTCDTPVIQSRDTVTIYAQALDNGVPLDDPYSLDYVIKHGSTTISSGSGIPGTGNKVHISYTGTGVGDVDVIVSNSIMSLQETYEVEDCVSYDTTEHTESFTSTRFKTITSSNLTNVSMSLDLKSTTYNYSCVLGKSYNAESDQIGFGTTDTSGRIYRTLNGTNNHSNYSGFNQNNVYYNLRFEKTGTTLKTYLNDTLIDTSTDNAVSNLQYLNFGSWRNNTIYYKNLKVKAL